MDKITAVPILALKKTFLKSSLELLVSYNIGDIGCAKFVKIMILG